VAKGSLGFLIFGSVVPLVHKSSIVVPKSIDLFAFPALRSISKRRGRRYICDPASIYALLSEGVFRKLNAEKCGAQIYLFMFMQFAVGVLTAYSPPIRKKTFTEDWGLPSRPMLIITRDGERHQPC